MTRVSYGLESIAFYMYMYMQVKFPSLLNFIAIGKFHSATTVLRVNQLVVKV